MGRKRRIIARLSKRGSEEEESFNREFWKRISGEKKLEIAWEMVADLYFIRGEKEGSKSRLRRSVERLLRRKATGRLQDKLDLEKLRKS